MPRSHAFVRLALLSLALTGCAGRPLPVSPGLAESTVQLTMVKVDRRSWNIGDYYVREIRRGWDKGGTVSLGQLSASKKTRDFSFSVTHGELSLQVRCNLTASSAGIGDLTVSDGQQVMCDLNPSNAAAPWKAILVERGSRDTQGRLQQGERELQVVPAHGSGFRPPRGYLIRQEGDFAAADVGRKTRTMWLPKAADANEALALAGAAVVLMLLEEVS